MFVREFYDVFGERQIPDCDYLVYAMLTESSSRQAPMSGMEYFETQSMNVMYSIYKFDKNTQKIKQVQEIIDNPTIIKHEKYTESFGRGAIASRVNNPTRRVLLSVRSYNNAYTEDSRRFSKVLKNIGGGGYNEFLNTQQNLIVLTAETQAKTDAYEQMAKSLARKVINDVSVKIDTDLNPVDDDDEKDDETIEQNEPQNKEDIKTDTVEKNHPSGIQHNKTIRKISDVIK